MRERKKVRDRREGGLKEEKYNVSKTYYPFPDFWKGIRRHTSVKRRERNRIYRASLYIYEEAPISRHNKTREQQCIFSLKENLRENSSLEES